MKIITLIILCFILSGCGQFGRIIAKMVGHSEHCIDGVMYIQFTSGATVKYNQNGTIANCN